MEALREAKALDLRVSEVGSDAMGIRACAWQANEKARSQRLKEGRRTRAQRRLLLACPGIRGPGPKAKLCPSKVAGIGLGGALSCARLRWQVLEERGLGPGLGQNGPAADLGRVVGHQDRSQKDLGLRPTGKEASLKVDSQEAHGPSLLFRLAWHVPDEVSGGGGDVHFMCANGSAVRSSSPRALLDSEGSSLLRSDLPKDVHFELCRAELHPHETGTDGCIKVPLHRA